MAKKQTNKLVMNDGTIVEIIPPIPSEDTRGGIVAKDKTTENVEVVIDKSTGKAYVKETDLSNYYNKSETDAKLETKQNTLTDADKQAIADLKDISSKADITYVDTELEKKQDVLDEEFEPSANLLNPEQLLVGKGVDDTTGKIGNRANLNTYDNIPVLGGEVYTLQRTDTITEFYAILYWYDSDWNLISKNGWEKATYSYYVFATAPTNAAYCRLVYRREYNGVIANWDNIMLSQYPYPNIYRPYKTFSDEYVYDSYSRLLKTYDDFSPNKMSFSAFKKWAVIGDSLSVGYIKNESEDKVYDRNLEYSWVQILARWYGNDAVNMGFSGCTVYQNSASSEINSWFNGKTYGYKDFIAEGNKCQAYVIGLGVNDLVDDTTLGTTDDIADTAADCGKSFIGQYGRIIRTILEYNSDAKIFIMTIPLHSGDDRETKNEAIKTVYNYFSSLTNVVLVDLGKKYLDIYSKRSIYNTTVAGHYTPAGYAILAFLNGAVLSQVIDDNKNKFKDISFIDYDESYSKVSKSEVQSMIDSAITDAIGGEY